MKNIVFAIRLVLTIVVIPSIVICDQVRGEDDALGERPKIMEAQAFLAKFEAVVVVRNVNSGKGKREVMIPKGRPGKGMDSLVKFANIYLEQRSVEKSMPAIDGVVICSGLIGPEYSKGRVYRLRDGRVLGTMIMLGDLLKASKLELQHQRSGIEPRAKRAQPKPESKPAQVSPIELETSPKRDSVLGK